MNGDHLILFSSMSIDEFSASQAGTKARFLVVSATDADKDLRHHIHQACKERNAACTITAQSILMEQKNGSWLPSTILTATIKRADRLEESMIYMLDDYHCAVKVVNGTLMFSPQQANNAIDMSQFTPVITPQNQDFLDEVNILLDCHFTMSDFKH